jgi:hypothetical protein
MAAGQGITACVACQRSAPSPVAAVQVALTTLLEIGKTLPEEDYAKQVSCPSMTAQPTALRFFQNLPPIAHIRCQNRLRLIAVL